MIEYKKYLWIYYHNIYQCFDKTCPGLSSKLKYTIEAIQSFSKSTTLSRHLIIEEIPKLQHSSSVISCSINIDCKTRDSHCERDVTCTTIIIPMQEHDRCTISFEFCISDVASLVRCCPQNSAFTNSAYRLTHRQLKTHGNKTMNLSSYSNKRFYCNYRQSFQRLLKKEYGTLK
jgi:hypothetical protein